MAGVHIRAVKATLIALLLSTGAFATTISVVPVYEPISLHGSDVDDIISDTGEALQATVLSRPMALTGAFPEDLVAAIRTIDEERVLHSTPAGPRGRPGG